MPFECPLCHGKTMAITFALELPPSDVDDEVALQTLKCPACEFHAIAVYRESRRGRIESESWYHHGYPITDECLERLYEAFLLCPSPGNRSCQCPSHRQLAQQNWLSPNLPGIDCQRRFEMRSVPSAGRQ
jgi:hypothetical protein